MADAFDNVNIAPTLVGCLFVNEPPEPRHRFYREHCIGRDSRLQSHATGSGADINYRLPIEGRDACHLGEVPAMKLQAIIDLGILVVDDQIGNRP